MTKASSLTLRILKPLYPWTNLDMVGEGFAPTCTKDEANKLIEDFGETTNQVMEMLLIDMS
jgi:hypothetical protein